MVSVWYHKRHCHYHYHYDYQYHRHCHWHYYYSHCNCCYYIAIIVIVVIVIITIFLSLLLLFLCLLLSLSLSTQLQYIPRNMHTVFALLCFVAVIHWLIFPYSSGLLHWHCGNLTIAPVPAKQSWWIWINTSCEFIMNDCITTTKQSTTKPCAYFLGYTVIHTVKGWKCFPLGEKSNSDR